MFVGILIVFTLKTFSGCLQYIDDPFKLYKLENVFYTGFIKKLRKELLELQFNHNVSDMFSVHQTCELYGLEGTVNNVNLITFLQFLNKFREFLMQLFSIPLKEQISVSGSMFTKGGKKRFDYIHICMCVSSISAHGSYL